MLNNVTKREKTFAIITVGLIIAALLYNFIFEPLAKSWNTLGSEIREKEGLFRKHNRILRNKEAIEKTHTEYSVYFGQGALTPEEESAEVLSNIEKLARSARVRITNIKPLTTKSFDNYNKYTFRVATESNISELTRFIYDLQTAKQLVKIERMVLRAKEREPKTIKSILHISKISVF